MVRWLNLSQDLWLHKVRGQRLVREKTIWKQTALDNLSQKLERFGSN